MREIHKRRIHSVNQFLNRPIAVIITLLLLFGYFVYSNHQYQAQNRALLESTNQNTMSTNQVVKGQTDILNAIKQLASDSKLDNNVKTNIIICMLQVPVAQRTTDLQERCRKQVETELHTSPSSASSPAPVNSTKSAGAGGVSATSQPAITQTGPTTPPPPPVNNSLFDRVIFNPVSNVLKEILGVQ